MLSVAPKRWPRGSTQGHAGIKADAKRDAAAARLQRQNPPPNIGIVNMVDPKATFSSQPPVNVANTSLAVTTATTFVGARSSDAQPTKKRRGRINSSNVELRNKPVTADAAYGLVEADENERVQKASDKVRARREREEEKRLKEVATLEEGVTLKPKLEALADKSAKSLSQNFTINQLKALIYAHAIEPTKGKKNVVARQLANIIQPQQSSQPLLLMDRR
eukprot:COSAG05_NODE_3459_length_2046_cov_14.818695_1_plen_220_part_00